MKKNYTRELKGKDWESCLDKSFKKAVKDAKVDGFRKGQVPKDIYIKKFGIESLYMDAVDEALPIMFENLMKESDVIEPACTPSISIKSINEKSVEIDFTIVSMPEVKLGKYKDLGVKKENVKVSDDEINHEIGHIKEQFAELKVTDKKIENGHIAVINFEGFKDGIPFEGGKGENYSLTIGSNSFIPGFEEGLIGLSAGDEKELNLFFPDNYHVEDLKGKEVVFKVKVNEVKERVVPNIDENFFKDLGMEGIDSEDKLKEEIKKNLELSKERNNEEEYIIKTLDLAIKNAKFEIPEEIILDETDRIYNEFSERLYSQGMDADNYLKITNSTKEDLMNQMKPEAEKRISYRLVVNAVAEKEKVEISDSELEKEIEKMTKKFNITKEELLKNVGDEKAILYDMKMKKALQIITGIKKEEE